MFAVCMQAQVCQPELKSSTLIYPDTTMYPCVVRNQPFAEPIHLFPPAFYQAADVDSIVITGISGLPSGISMACNPESCVYRGGEHGCILLSGTTTDAPGHYHLLLLGTAYLTMAQTGSFSLSLDQLTNFMGAPPSTYGVDVINEGEGCRIATGLNGLSNSANITLHYSAAEKEIQYQRLNDEHLQQVSVYSYNGELMLSQKINQQQGAFNTKSWSTGVYAVLVQSNNRSVVYKIAVY